MSTATLSPLTDLATRINAEHAACLASAQDAITRAIEVGRLLAEAKTQAQHGQWAAWVESNCSFAMRQAQNYMRVFHNRDQVEAQIRNGDSHLDSLRGVVLALAEPKLVDDKPMMSAQEAREALTRLEPIIEAGIAKLCEFMPRQEALEILAEFVDEAEVAGWRPGAKGWPSQELEEKVTRRLMEGTK
jgi:hypothetical protein